MADKVKFSITSDGTSEGTKVILNGENIIESKKIVSCDFYANAATAYPSYDGEMKQYPENISFGYTAVDKNDKGEKTYTRYNFNLAESKWEPKITPLGVKTPEEGISANDNILGQETPLIKNILDYVGKTKKYIPSRAELLIRTEDSLNDLLEDIKKEV